MFSVKIPTKQCKYSLFEMAPHLSALAVVLALESIPEFHVGFEHRNSG